MYTSTKLNIANDGYSFVWLRRILRNEIFGIFGNYSWLSIIQIEWFFSYKFVMNERDKCFVCTLIEFSSSSISPSIFEKYSQKFGSKMVVITVLHWFNYFSEICWQVGSAYHWHIRIKTEFRQKNNNVWAIFTFKVSFSASYLQLKPVNDF